MRVPSHRGKGGGTLEARVRLLLAAMAAGGIIAGAAGTAAAYWVVHHGPPSATELRTFTLEFSPTSAEPYQAYVPVPASPDGTPARLALRVVEGEPRFTLVDTGRGVGLSVQAAGPVRLEGEGAFPIRLSMDGVPSSFRQFKFWGFLAEDAGAPVLLKLELRSQAHREDWEQHTDAGRAIVVTQALEPAGWQVLRATHLFDIRVAGGHGQGFAPLAMGALVASLGSLYLPLGALLLGARVARGRDGFK